MPTTISSPIQLRPNSNMGFLVKSINLHELGELQSPIISLDDFYVSGQPFSPHPHAGFSAVTYVFEDSAGGLRSADSLGNDIRVGPGGTVWAQAGRGLMHHEIPEQSHLELHGVQLFVNLSATNKLMEPNVLYLESKDVPEWLNKQGDRVRIIAGHYQSMTSPLTPTEPFTMLDVELHHALEFELEPEHFGLLYLRHGTTTLISDTNTANLDAGHAIFISGGGRIRVEAMPSARFLFLSGVTLHDPVVTYGPFVMNSKLQISNAIERFNAGEMGNLAPLSME